jgi:1,2-diacylglycerol 3-alpha-glucosyltransferase
MNPLSVGEFNDSYDPIMDGVSMVAKSYSYWLTKKGNDCTLVAVKFPSYIASEEYRVLQFFSLPLPNRPPYRIGLPSFDLPFRHRLFSRRFDLVHTHCPFMSGHVALEYARRRKVPIVSTFHTKYRDDFERAVGSKAIVNWAVNYIVDYYNKVDFVWVPVEGTIDTLREYGYKGPVEVMPNGSDMDPTPEERADLRRKGGEALGIASDVFTMLYIGQHIWEKNLHILLDALEVLNKAGRNFRMAFVGDGYARNEMERIVAKRGLSGKVSFFGIVQDRELIKAFYARADIVAFPSLYDTSSLCVKEAAGFRTPSLLIRGATTAAGVADGVNGFLADNSGAAYAERIGRIMDDPGSIAAVGTESYGTLFRSWKDVIDEVEERYRKIIGDYRKP